MLESNLHTYVAAKEAKKWLIAFLLLHEGIQELSDLCQSQSLENLATCTSVADSLIPRIGTLLLQYPSIYVDVYHFEHPQALDHT